jgi:hypothetical protein
VTAGMVVPAEIAADDHRPPQIIMMSARRHDRTAGCRGGHSVC